MCCDRRGDSWIPSKKSGANLDCAFVYNAPLIVFSIGSCEQKGVSLLTPVLDSVFIDLSDGTFLFSLHGSFKNHQHKAL